MPNAKTKPKAEPLRTLRIIWGVFTIVLGTAIGAAAGWESHGLAGAVAMGFVGSLVGGFLSSPSIAAQFFH
ncbi:hypothetical protein [Shinella sp.]|uniref:hypothetical protein n=1 Tax=Shinella sp. TaxID=1870904 RepID=UPI004036E43B